MANFSGSPNILSGGFPLSSGGSTIVDGPGSSTDNALVRWNGTTGNLVQNGVVTEDDFTGTLNGPLNNATTTAAGSAFTNQPANDGIEVLSSDAGDTTQTVTIIGTTNGVNTVVVETVTLNGTTPVATVKTDWGIVLAVKKSAATLGTVTVREASADQTITAGLTAAVLSVGVNTVSTTAAYNRVVSIVASGATTKQLGLGGTDSSSAQIYDSVVLTGATAEPSNSAFLTLTEIYTGDVEASRTVTITASGVLNINAGTVGINSTTIPPAFTNSVFNANRVIQVGFFSSTPTILGVRSQGSSGAPSAIGSGNTMLAIGGNGYDGSVYAGGSVINFVPTETWGTTAHGAKISFATIRNTTTVAQSVIEFGHYGQITQLFANSGQAAAWGTAGACFSQSTGTLTDTSTAGSGTAAIAVFNSFAGMTLAATNSLVTTTDVFNGYFTAPIQGTNQTITRKHTLGIVDSTSAASAITGGLIVATTVGTAATSVGIGGGNVNAGGSVVSGGVATVSGSTATPAAGSTSAVLLFGTTAGFGIYYGSNAPTVSAAQGSIYLRSDGSGIANRLYVNTTGSTTWTNFVTAA